MVFEEDAVKFIIKIRESNPEDTVFRWISKYLSNLKGQRDCYNASLLTSVQSRVGGE